MSLSLTTCDFGIARISKEVNKSLTSKTLSGHILRYSAPELIANDFAILILEFIMEEVLLPNPTRDAAAVHAKTSKKPTHLCQMDRTQRTVSRTAYGDL
jgi:hypothetical protein